MINQLSIACDTKGQTNTIFMLLCALFTWERIRPRVWSDFKKPNLHIFLPLRSSASSGLRRGSVTILSQWVRLHVRQFMSTSVTSHICHNARRTIGQSDRYHCITHATFLRASLSCGLCFMNHFAGGFRDTANIFGGIALYEHTLLYTVEWWSLTLDDIWCVHVYEIALRCASSFQQGFIINIYTANYLFTNPWLSPLLCFSMWTFVCVPRDYKGHILNAYQTAVSCSPTVTPKHTASSRHKQTFRTFTTVTFRLWTMLTMQELFHLHTDPPSLRHHALFDAPEAPSPSVRLSITLTHPTAHEAVWSNIVDSGTKDYQMKEAKTF